jgi:hypothetical protein
VKGLVTDLRRHPWLSFLLLSALVAAGGATREIFALRSSAKTSRHRLERINRELRSLSERGPTPTAENAAAIAEDLSAGQRALDEWRAALPAELTAPAREKNSRVEIQRPQAFFELASFVERMRDRAQRAGVRIKADERFGFAAYAHEAPPAPHVAEVMQHQRRIEILIGAVLDARPDEIAGVEGDFSRPPGPVKSMPAARLSGSSGKPIPAKDSRALDPRCSLRTAGAIETTAYWVSFLGTTSVLRAVLNALADPAVPLWVRTVEVTPADSLSGKKTLETGEVAPLVARTRSRFDVTVEAIAFAPATTSHP